jgi:N-methylhydantoinase A
MLRVGIDVGGTFTDLFAHDEATGESLSAKVLTTVHNQSEGVVGAIASGGVGLAEVGFLAHGTTTGTNALIERRGAVTALITTEGFRDVLEIMRTDRESGYDLHWAKPQAMVPRRLRFEVPERLGPDGAVLAPLDGDAARAVAAGLPSTVTSVAIVFLHAYANPSHEARMREILAELRPEIAVSLSSEVNAEYREYERTSTTVVDAYIKPVMVRYLGTLVEALRVGGLGVEPMVMQGSGGMVTLGRAAEKPIGTLSSGPAAGTIAAAAIGSAAGFDDIVTFDVGGTSTDVSLIQGGVPFVSAQKQVEWGVPARVPMIDVESVGAGGGSLGWIDQGGALKMGPRSAGSTPGPICYGGGGVEPALSDALLVAGILGTELAGGRVSLDAEAAARGIEERLCEPLGLPLDRVVAGMIEIAQENMANAVRSVSIWKGLDPRDLTLMAFGGAGGLVAGPVARALDIPRVLVPMYPGNTCAMGLLMTDMREDVTSAFLAPSGSVDLDALNARLEALTATAVATLVRQGIEEDDVAVSHHVDVRYTGQIYELGIPLSPVPATAETIAAATAEFERRYEDIYTIRLEDAEPELVSVRVTATGRLTRYQPPAWTGGGEASVPRTRTVLEAGERREAAVHDRYALPAGARIDGPAILEEPGSTVWIASGMAVEVDPSGNLIIDTGAGSSPDGLRALTTAEA